MSEFDLRGDTVEATGIVTSVWAVPFNNSDLYNSGPCKWHVVLQLLPGDPLLATSDGKVNVFDWLVCQVTPAAPFRNEPFTQRLLAEIVGKKVRLNGTWGDVIENGFRRSTIISPIAWILVDQSTLPTLPGNNFSVSPIIEEHGFSQVVRDVDLFAFSDHTPFNSDISLPNHHLEDRHIQVEIPFPFKPQTNSVPIFEECVDRDHLEQILYGKTLNPAPAFPIHANRQHSMNILTLDGKDVLQITVDTGSPTLGQGFFYAKLALTYDEGFDKMCQPDACLIEPGQSCQATGEERLTYVWPQLDSALVGDLLIGPAGGAGVLGRLLGALNGPQFFDHMAIFVENDGRSLRHCTASDDRIANEKYYTTVEIGGAITIGVKLPLAGLRPDILRFAWPGTINQTLGEICGTGHNRSNPQFSFSTLYSEVVANEASISGHPPPLLWQLTPKERTKRTSFHDPESRDIYQLARLQKDAAFREEINVETGRQVGWIWPNLVKPHPELARGVRELLNMVAIEAKKIVAHYRFYSYSKADIAVNSSFNAPPPNEWGSTKGSDWAANTQGAVCSSFIWAAVQEANHILKISGKPHIELEGKVESQDQRQGADYDGLYLYSLEERIEAAKELFSFTYDRVSREVDKVIADAPDLVNILVDIVPGVGDTIDDVKDYLARVVANQLCNTFAFDAVEDIQSTWKNPGSGIAVSPDDIMLRWDVSSTIHPPPTYSEKANIYGQCIPIIIPEPGWRKIPIYRILKVIGKGTVQGTVVRRIKSNEPPIAIAGATVRFGCKKTETGVIKGSSNSSFAFIDTEAGRYHIQAMQFIYDPILGVSQEWKSVRKEIELRDGGSLNGIVLELLPPPGIARTVNIKSHHDIVDRVVIGKDRWGHFDLNRNLQLAYDPLDILEAPSEQKNTKLSDKLDSTTEEVGSGVHVRVTVDARLNKLIAADGSITFDKTVICDITITFFDTGEGEINGTLSFPNILIYPGNTWTKSYNMVSDDDVPERASGTVTISNLIASLP